MEERITELVATLFPVPVQGISGKQAREIIDCMPPFEQIRERFPTLDVRREITAHEAMHLGWDGLALIAEEMLRRYGKEGEFIVYDVRLGYQSTRGIREVEVEEFMARRVAQYSDLSEAAKAWGKGELVEGTDSEVITRITECEFGRYYQVHHPRVGYLLACSMDNAKYYLANKRIRLQRTTTLMEGGTECDFRVYALEQALVGE